MFLMKALLDLKFRIFWGALWGLICVLMTPAFSLAGEANLVIPELSQEQNTLLLAGIVICLLGMVFGYYQFTQVKKLPAHPSMLDVAQTIYETCKTYLIQQGKFIAILFAFIGVCIAFYFGYLQKMPIGGVLFILMWSRISRQV
jgi:K(+)-stimulated pyrophosphate-energized sodium pump